MFRRTVEDAEAWRARTVLSDLLAAGGLSEEQPTEVTDLLHVSFSSVLDCFNE